MQREKSPDKQEKSTKNDSYFRGRLVGIKDDALTVPLAEIFCKIFQGLKLIGLLQRRVRPKIGEGIDLFLLPRQSGRRQAAGGDLSAAL